MSGAKSRKWEHQKPTNQPTKENVHWGILSLNTYIFSMAEEVLPSYDEKPGDKQIKVKIICLGDSAVGKSK